MPSGMGGATTKAGDTDQGFLSGQPRPSVAGSQPASPLAQRPLGAAGTKISKEAMEGRHDLIEKVLIPRLTELIKALHAANLAGQIGPGEIALLGDLQHWLFQLQVEHDDLNLRLKKPGRGKKKK